MEPRRIWWARPRKLCAMERPGGGGRSHHRGQGGERGKDRATRVADGVVQRAPSRVSHRCVPPWSGFDLSRCRTPFVV